MEDTAVTELHVTEPSRRLLLRQKPFHTFEHVGEGVELGPMFPYNTSITFLVFGFTMIQGTTSRHLRRTFGMLVGATLET